MTAIWQSQETKIPSPILICLMCFNLTFTISVLEIFQLKLIYDEPQFYKLP